MPAESVDRAELDDVAAQLGSPLRVAGPVGWGDARATHRLSLADGRSYAARRFGSEPTARAEQIGRVMTRLAEDGLPVPTPALIETSTGPWLLTPWIEGETGASWLGDPARARHLADRMGRLARRLRDIELVHGDFVPMNVVMGADGEIAALLDFEHAGVGASLLDVAWWGWVVRHHHPEAWRAAWPTLLVAAGLEARGMDAPLHELALQTLATRAAAAQDAGERERWRERLAAARAWRVPGDQAT